MAKKTKEPVAPTPVAYEVVISAYVTVHVQGAKDNEEAERLARDQVDLGDMTVDVTTTEPLMSPFESARSKRHADVKVKAT